MLARRLGLATLSVGAVLMSAAAARAAPPIGNPRLPTPPNAAVSKGLSLEHECLNAVKATRALPKMKHAAAGDDQVKQADASDHLDRAEVEARAGRGQACEDEVSSATDSLSAMTPSPGE